MISFKEFLLETQEPPEGLHLHDLPLPAWDDNFVAAYHKNANTEVHKRFSGPEYHDGVTNPPTGFKKENMVGYARFHKNKNESVYFSSETHVDSGWRRKGIASAIYKHASKSIKIRPSVALSGIMPQNSGNQNQ